MINSNHIEILMGYIKALNVNKKLDGKKYLSDDQLREKQNSLINIANKMNKVENWFVNNWLVLLTQDVLFLFKSTKYPEYIYLKSRDLYLININIRPVNDIVIAELNMTSSPTHATNVSGLWFWQKRKLIKQSEEIFEKETGEKQTFRIKRILTYT